MDTFLCPWCQLFGKPQARVNFIILAGGPDSVTYQRIKYLLQNDSETNTSISVASSTNYDTLMTIHNRVYGLESRASSTNLTTTNFKDICCHGYLPFQFTINNISNADEWAQLRERFIDLLERNKDENLHEDQIKIEAPSWILLYGSICLERPLLDIFITLNNQNLSLYTNTFTILGLLVDEEELFKCWLCRNVAHEDYEKNTYPEYERRIKGFFSLLNSSQYLQEHTLLVEDKGSFTNIELKEILKDLFQQNISKYSSTNSNLRSSMEKLLKHYRRTVRDIRTVRRNLQSSYQNNAQYPLESICNRLKNSNTAAEAAREVIQLVLNEFTCLNKEQKRAYKRQFLCGFNISDPQDSNTIAAQLVNYGLTLLDNYDASTIPLLYAVIMTICKISTHFHFRHELFNNTLKTFTLSLSLVSQQHYALVIAGLQLCERILNADQNEHKYARVFLSVDSLAARKFLDAIKWLLSPYQKLQDLWNEREDLDTESGDDDSSTSLATEYCSQHTENLVDRVNLKVLASLFYACFDHCLQVTEDDVHQIVDVITILADPNFTKLSRSCNKYKKNLLFITHLCALLTPILLNGPTLISLALMNETRLLTIIPTTIASLHRTYVCNMDQINIALRFYMLLIQRTETYNDTSISNSSGDDDDDDETDIKELTVTTTELVSQPTNSLYLTKDLLSSYYTLHQQFQMLIQRDEAAAQRKQFQALFETEWKKIDTLQLKHDYEQMKQENQSLNERLVHLDKELQRTQSERDQYRKEYIQLAQEIDRLKLSTSTNVIINSTQVSTTVSVENNITDKANIIHQLNNLSPDQITSQQAEQFIREIYGRRTTFKDEDMRKSICGSLKHLGSDLYSSSVHFLDELIQNAEDNIYIDKTSPSLRIELNHDYILFSNNEQGLRSHDVLAICSLAVTTKTSEQKHIGEKGVGFKSVFVASNQPTLVSHAWQFRFQVPGSDAMSYITPLWIRDEDIPECILKQISTNRRQTHLYLPLKLAAHTPLAEQFLDDVSKAVDPCILLNMRQLENLEIVDLRENKSIIIKKQRIGSTKLETQTAVTFEDLTFLNLNGSVIKLCTPKGDRIFRVYNCQIDVPSTIEQRRNPTTSLTLAFPYDYDLNATVYTGLPVCNLGFNFMFNAEFHLVTSRENVRENVPFNTYLRDHLAVFFVYLLLNDMDLKKDISRYCPSSDIHQIKYSSWWHSMIDRITRLITKHFSALFDIRRGKSTRYWNPNLADLISKEQLDNYANIQVIDSNDKFFTADRLRSFQIQTLSITDILKCFPSRDEQINEFQQWVQKKDKQWWSQFFHYLSEAMTPDIAELMLEKPIFLLQNNDERQYLPINNKTSLLLYINDDPSIRIWKQRLIVLQYSSSTERTALLQSNHVNILTEKDLIDIIQKSHLELVVSSMMLTVGENLLEEIWKDLFYLQSRIEKLDNSKPLLIPIQGSSCLTVIQNTTLPTIFGLDIRPYVHSTPVTFVHIPYYNVDSNRLINHLQWESFLLKMHCKPPLINLPQDYTIARLPYLPLFTMFTDEKHAHLGEFILSVQSENTRQALQQFPIVAQVNSKEETRPISTTFDEFILTDLPKLPLINVPSYCRSLAMNMGVRTEYDLMTCMTILQYLSNEKITNVDLYIEWLGRLQLEIRKKDETIDMDSFRSTCHLYFSDQQKFCLLKDLLVMSEINDQHYASILLVCKYLKLQLISSTSNQTYWQFKDLFRTLDCQCKVTVENIYRTIRLARNDKKNFYQLGDGLTTLNEDGMETMITLYQYLEDSIAKCVQDSESDTDLYRTIITQKHPKAPYGSREDLQWRFALISKKISPKLKEIISTSIQNISLPLLTNDRQLIEKTSTNNVYACFETKIIQNLSRTIGKRHFISPVITRACPLVLALSEIDYVERRGKIKWIHSNLNLENHLTQLTAIFREATNDDDIEVISARYAEIFLLISDAAIIETVNDDDYDDFQMESDYAFWIFNKTVFLCIDYVKDVSSKAIVAISALATLLHKYQYIPFDEAKLIARQKITQWNEFISKLPSHFASTKPGIYPYLDVIFPKDHESIESMVISIGQNPTTEQDPEEIFIAPERSLEDESFRQRVMKQNHRDLGPKTPNNWMNPIIVDGIEHIRIGQNAEHFFFTYLQNLYGEIDVTPTKNWRSSSRAKVYPQYKRNMNDSLGYDLELHDTKEYFVRGLKSRTKICYFEVKGTSGSFHEDKTVFHISQNELEKCKSITFDSRKHEREAYFFVIVEHCLDPEMIALAKVFDWSSNFYSIELKNDSYQCKFYSPSSIPIIHDYSEDDNTRNSRRFHDNYYSGRGQQHSHPTYYNNQPEGYRFHDGNQQEGYGELWPSQQYQPEYTQNTRARGRGRGRGRGGRYSKWQQQ
ncbi:unnamed protein product [Adineta steineri]|uniref:Uncharacterized protein n=1 Tax=Adineta steineri TaxID=433720 RepID=A0A818WFU1_9BILA|nr:unnamed protein product [Adineta steineri]CAF3725192.1 unnamed protein product [Adineta steineri]